MNVYFNLLLIYDVFVCTPTVSDEILSFHHFASDVLSSQNEPVTVFSRKILLGLCSLNLTFIKHQFWIPENSKKTE